MFDHLIVKFVEVEHSNKESNNWVLEQVQEKILIINY